MPLYEYQCKVCGVRFERQQPITADPVKICPECGGEVHRLIHPVGIIFKGKGFYVTDNRKAKSSTGIPGTKKETSSASESTDSTASTASAGSDSGSKSEASTESD